MNEEREPPIHFWNHQASIGFADRIIYCYECGTRYDWPQTWMNTHNQNLRLSGGSAAYLKLTKKPWYT